MLLFLCNKLFLHTFVNNKLKTEYNEPVPLHLKKIIENTPDNNVLITTLANALTENLPLIVSGGGFIKEG